MPALTGSEFIYDNMVSSKFGLQIGYIGTQPPDDGTFVTNEEFIVQKLPRRSRVYFFGAGGREQLSFPMSFFRDSPIYADERDAIANWLTGKAGFKRLQIVQDDMISVSYNCYFSDLKYVAVAGKTYGFEATVICDAPFAWKNPQWVEKINTPSVNGDYPSITEFNLFNLTSDNNLIRPTSVLVELSDNCNAFSLVNISNNNEKFQFENLTAGEKISINCDLEIIESLTRPNTVIVDNFSGDFLTLVNGLNKIKVDGQIKRIRIDYQSGRKIG